MQKMTFENYLYDALENEIAVNTLASLNKTVIQPKVLCLWGENSSGKTHLLQAVTEACHDRTVRYMTSDEIIQRLSQALQDGSLDAYKRSFENVDILLVDDAQFFAGRTATLCFLREYVFPQVRRNVVMASDCDPCIIGLLRERDKVLRLEQPNLRIRQMIVSGMAAQLHLTLSSSTQHLIASEFSDIRQIYGFLTFLKATKTTNTKTTEDEALGQPADSLLLGLTMD